MTIRPMVIRVGRTTFATTFSLPPACVWAKRRYVPLWLFHSIGYWADQVKSLGGDAQWARRLVGRLVVD